MLTQVLSFFPGIDQFCFLRYHYQLLSMVAMDQFGHGQPVQYSLLETNADWHMAKSLDHFKRANEHWRFVRIVTVDKDLREVEVVRQKLPEARILYCHFHVIQVAARNHSEVEQVWAVRGHRADTTKAHDYERDLRSD
jgi:hypothetical protein